MKVEKLSSIYHQRYARESYHQPPRKAKEISEDISLEDYRSYVYREDLEIGINVDQSR